MLALIYFLLPVLFVDRILIYFLVFRLLSVLFADRILRSIFFRLYSLRTEFSNICAQYNDIVMIQPVIFMMRKILKSLVGKYRLSLG